MGAAKAMFNLLGFHFAEDKLAPPADKAELLGVELDLKQSKQGKISIRNRQDRVTDLEAAMSEILEARKLRPKDLPSHLGRMQFAEMQIAGRAGKIAMHDLRTMGSSGAAYVTLEDDQLDALKLLRTRLTSGKPRSLVAQPPSKPWLLFTDGALEYNNDSPVATIGAILLSPAGQTWYFGCRVPDEVMNLWRSDGKEHVIGLVELYACVVSLKLWKPLLESQKFVLFIDNYGAQDSLVKGSATVLQWRKLLMILEEMDDELFTCLWVTRVPSHSNPADHPTRGSIKEIAYLQPMTRCEPSCPVIGKALETIC
jgi:hypothetical protein